MGVERRLDALAEVTVIVAGALAERDPEAARFMGERFRRMLARTAREEEGFCLAFEALMAVEDAAGVS
jgi:hypothetical protein